MGMAAFWDVAPCSLADTDRRFKSLLSTSSRRKVNRERNFGLDIGEGGRRDKLGRTIGTVEGGFE
jgi:hypothetical protein